MLADTCAQYGLALSWEGRQREAETQMARAVALYQPEMEAEQGKEQCREHHYVKRKKALNREFAYFRTAAQHVGHDWTDPRNRRRDLEANLGGEVAELIHGQKIA